MNSGLTVTPKYLIKSRKEQLTLRCSSDSGHRSVYWYQQALGQNPRFLFQYHDGKVYQKGNISDKVSGKQFCDDARFELSLTSLELTDSAMYLCARSQDTALLIRCFWDKNTPAPAQEVVPSVSAASLPGPVSDFPRHLLLGMF